MYTKLAEPLCSAKTNNCILCLLFFLSQIQLLHALHENGDLVVLGGQLYVTGGHWKGMEGDYSVEVEVYNRASNTWKVGCFLPRLWNYSGCCSIFLDTSQWTEFFPDET